MGALTDSVGLLFQIRAENETKPAFREAGKDISDFSAKGSAELDKLTGSSKNLSTSFDSLKEGFSNVATGVGAVVAVTSAAAVGMFALAKNTADAASEITRFASLTGLSVQTVNSLKIAAEQTGKSLETIEEIWESFSEQLSDAASGNEDSIKNLSAAGIKAKDVYTDLEGTLSKAIKYVADGASGVEQNTRAMKLFGESGLDIINVTKQMGGNIEEYTKKLKDNGLVLDEEGIRRSKEFNRSLSELSLQATAVANNFATGFMPKITSAMEEISGSVRGNKSVWQEWGETVGDMILRLTRGLPVVIALMKDAAQAMRGNFFFTGSHTLAALQQNADAYKNDEIKKATRDYMNDPNRPDWLKQMDAAIEKTATSGDGKTTRGDGAKLKKEDFELSKDGKALVEAANRLGISPLDLATIISYETSGTFSPKIRGGKGGNYTGLIQFGKEEAAKYKIAQNNTFASQLLNSVVPFLKDRFASVGRDTSGATILDLYKTINGGNPNVSSNASDGNGTIAQHVERMLRQHQPKALNKFFGGKESNVESDKIGEQYRKALEEEKKFNEEKVKLNDEATKRVLERAKQAADEENAINEKLLAEKKISQDEFEKRREKSDIELLQKEKILLEDRLAFARLFGTSTIEIEQEIDAVVSQLRVKQTEAETAAYLRSKKYQEDLKQLRFEVLQSEREVMDFRKEQQRKILENDVEFSRGRARLDALVVLREFEREENKRRRDEAIEDAKREKDLALEGITDLEKEKEKVEEINKLYQNRLDTINSIYKVQNEETAKQFDPAIGQAEAGVKAGSFFGTITKGIADYLTNVVLVKDANGQLQFSFSQLFETMGNLGLQAFGQLAQGFGSMVANFVLYGSKGENSLRKMVAGVLANVAQMATTYALMSLAAAALATTVWGAALLGGTPAQFLQAAALFGAVAVGATIAGRAVAGNAFTASNQANQANTSGAAGGHRGGSGNSGQAYSSHGSETQVINQGINQPTVHRFEIVFNGKDYIAEAIRENVGNNGSLRDLFKDMQATFA